MCDKQSLRSACMYPQSDQNLCKSLEYSMRVKLLTEQYLEFLSLKRGFTGLSKSTLVKMPHCWKSHVTANVCFPMRKPDFFAMHAAEQVGLSITLSKSPKDRFSHNKCSGSVES